VAEGIVHESHISSEDVPTFHVSHDWNADVLLDPAYNFLNSDENPQEGPTQRIMEIEWESAFFPPQFWPAPGDRAWMLGRWIFDCGHPPYKTEIHPPKAVAFTHTEPVIFPGDQRPSQSSLTHVYIHGRGGYYKRPVVGQNYDFDVPLPPRPAQPSTLRTTVLSLPFGGTESDPGPGPKLQPTHAARHLPAHGGQRPQQHRTLRGRYRSRVANQHPQPERTHLPAAARDLRLD